MPRHHALALALVLVAASAMPAKAETDNGAIKTITIRAPRDIGFFTGDLVRADVDVVVDPSYKLDEASLPHPGPVAYWLDLRSIAVTSRSLRDGARRYTLHLVYQDFYDALDARRQEIPALPLRLTNDKGSVTANVPSWGIGVSPLREISPPPKDDPKDYLRPDMSAQPPRSGPWFWGAGGAALAALLALVPLAADRAWFPFHQRPARVFASAARHLRRLQPRGAEADAYLEALLVLHRGIDQTDGRRVLADDVPAFLTRHGVFAPARDNLARFFAASRYAFFGSDPGKARAVLGYDALLSTARQLATLEQSVA